MALARSIHSTADIMYTTASRRLARVMPLQLRAPKNLTVGVRNHLRLARKIPFERGTALVLRQRSSGRSRSAIHNRPSAPSTISDCRGAGCELCGRVDGSPGRHRARCRAYTGNGRAQARAWRAIHSVGWRPWSGKARPLRGRPRWRRPGADHGARRRPAHAASRKRRRRAREIGAVPLCSVPSGRGRRRWLRRDALQGIQLTRRYEVRNIYGRLVVAHEAFEAPVSEQTPCAIYDFGR